MVLLDIFTLPSPVLWKTKFSERCLHTQNAISLGIVWWFAISTVAAFFQNLCSTSCLHAVLPSISLNLVLIIAIKQQEIKFQEKCLHSPHGNSWGNIREFGISEVAALFLGSVWNCCAVDKSDVHTSILSAVSNNFYHRKLYETDLPSPCKAYHSRTRRFVG